MKRYGGGEILAPSSLREVKDGIHHPERPPQDRVILRTSYNWKRSRK
jgi:hypothetical protein